MPGRRIMIVDDEENVLQALKRALIDEDYTIVTARDAKEALDKLGIFPADIVMSDYTMPGMSGLEFLQQTKRHYPDTIRILITGKSDTQITIEAINRGEIFRFLL
ncbi:MAG: response regulator, partial [Syntrophaceae bacterium]|nr:response regulator [Syntrophaceae bacterium]